jgi:DNA-binding CsgD family transcriptional regulator
MVSLSWAHLHTGELRQARETAVAAEELCRATAQPYWHAAAVAALLWLDAGRLEGPAFDAAFQDRVAHVDLEAVSPHAASMLKRACAVSCLSRGRYREAYDLLAADFADTPGWRWWAFAELAQAGVHAGHGDHVAGFVPLLAALADATGSPLLQRYRAFTAPLVAPDADAEELFRTGLDALADDVHLRARLAHEFGGWLRRRRRVRESREVLRDARAVFARDGLLGWVEQVDTELRATGEGADRDPVLTPQEAAVAQLVATGLSNREVAEALRISHRTVSTHLQRIFRKLGIDNRAQLSRSGTFA